MNRTRNVLLVCAIGLSAEICAHPIIKTVGIGLSVGGLHFGIRAIDQAAFKVEKLLTASEVLQESAVLAAGTAIIAAPVYFGLEALNRGGDRRCDERSHQYNGQKSMEESLAVIVKSSEQSLFDKKDHDFRSLNYNVYESKRFAELYKKPSEGDQIVTNLLNVSPILLSSASVISLFGCHCPKIAAGALAASYVTAGTAFIKEKMQTKNFKDAQDQIHSEISQKMHEKDLNHCARVDQIIHQTREKVQAIKADKSRHHYGHDQDIKTMIENMVEEIK